MAALFFTWLTVVAGAGAQLQLTSLDVVVVDQNDRPVPNALLILSDPLGAEFARLTTNANGRATFEQLPRGSYRLETRAPLAAPFGLPVAVNDAIPIQIAVRVPATITDAITVEGGRLDSPSSRSSLVGGSLHQTPVRLRGRGLQDAIASLAGWTTEDNGLLHARGVDDGFLYVIDGVPVYERLDTLHGFAPDLTAISAISVMTGYVPPEFGHKAGGVIDVRTAPANASWNAIVDVTAGSDATRDGSLSAGGRLGERGRVTAAVLVGRSDRFLDPIHPDNLHNTGGRSGAFGQFNWLGGADDLLTAGWGYARSTFEVPHTAEQENAGQDQRQRIRQGHVNATWQRAWSPVTVGHGTLYHRDSGALLRGSRFDTPLAADADRRLARTGGLFAISHQQGSHLLKLGVEYQRLSLDERFSFAVTAADAARDAGFRDEALAFTSGRPFMFSGRNRTALWSAYAQDSWQLAPRLTVAGGVRFDRIALLLPRSQLSPRVGAAWRFDPATVLRASVSRFLQPPQPENLLLSSSLEARALSAIATGDAQGGADLEPERQWATEVGFERHLDRRVRLDVAYWRRRIRHAADPNVFAGTTIIFPNAVAHSRAHGVEARVEVRGAGWSAHVNAAAGRVVQTGPVTGGLFLEDEIEHLGPGVEFTPDHDQRFAAGSGITWQQARSGLVVSATARYETGTPVQSDDDEELRERPGAEVVDFESGRVRPRFNVSLVATAPLMDTERADAHLTIQVLNLFDARYAYNFGNPFSGTHFGAPRSVAARLKVSFR